LYFCCTDLGLLCNNTLEVPQKKKMGRPKKFGQDTLRIAARFPVGLIKELRQAAKRRKVTISEEIIQRCLNPRVSAEGAVMLLESTPGRIELDPPVPKPRRQGPLMARGGDRDPWLKEVRAGKQEVAQFPEAPPNLQWLFKGGNPLAPKGWRAAKKPALELLPERRPA